MINVGSIVKYSKSFLKNLNDVVVEKQMASLRGEVLEITQFGGVRIAEILWCDNAKSKACVIYLSECPKNSDGEKNA
jgi:hypothetical protein